MFNTKGVTTMIYELEKTLYSLVTPLLEGELINIEIKSVVQGYNPGCVFVDSIDSPSTAMVWSKAIDGFYFIGSEVNDDFNDSINDYIDRIIAPRAKVLGLKYFEFSGTSKAWDKTINRIFKDRSLDRSIQLTYIHKHLDTISDDSKLSKELKLVTIDPLFFTNNISNLDFAKTMILDWWNSIEDFYKFGVGYCLFDGNMIVSCCVSSCVTNDAMGSHTVTLDEYRGKGLAKVLIKEFLKYCRDNDFKPNWDCMDKNTGSKALAESCGFSKVYDYILYDFKF